MPAILGLNAALEFLQQRGLDAVHHHEQALTATLLAGLRAVDGVRLYGPGQVAGQVGVVSFTVAGYDPREVASMLDATYRIQARSGFHCAPRMHQQLGTDQGGGTVRLSLGPFNTPEQIESAINAVGEISASSG